MDSSKVNILLTVTEQCKSYMSYNKEFPCFKLCAIFTNHFCSTIYLTMTLEEKNFYIAK